MTRPAIVIGLGGTGQWVLTYLKKDLIELNNGKMPKNVSLLAFDTVSKAEAAKQVTGYTGEQAKYETAKKRVGAVELEPDVELIHIGGDCWPLGQEIKRGTFKHLNWFDVDYWQRTVQRENWYLDRGAGRFRQFGLLAIYKDLLGGATESEILMRLPAAIESVMGVAEGESFEVVIVSSVAGGTGSSMLIPFGVMARALFPRNASVRTRAVVVLPTAFSPRLQTSEDLSLRSQAALRELARAMMPPEGYQSHIELLPGHPTLGRVEFSRPFDEIFFVDGTRGAQVINQDPKYAVFPASAAWIRQLLDDTSGKWYSEYVTANRSGSTVTDQKRMTEGVFTVFGVHSKYAPERTLSQTYELKLANQLLQRLLDPIPDDRGGRLIPKIAKNVTTPAEMSRQILKQTASFEDEQQVVTLFHSEIARILIAGGKQSSDDVTKKSTAGVPGKSRKDLSDSWFSILTNLPKASEYELLHRRVAKAQGANIANRFKPSDAFNPPRDPGGTLVFQELTVNMDHFINENYGSMGAEGADDYGEFGAMAQVAANHQAEIFKNIVRLRILSLLSESKCQGQLGYVIQILNTLENDLNEFSDFLKEVERVRSGLALPVDLAKNVEARRTAWMKYRGEKPSLIEKLQGKYSETALSAEKAYIKARSDLVGYCREEALSIAVRKAVNEMTSFTKRSREHLDRWVSVLLEGEKAQDLNGILATVRSDLDKVVTNIKEDQRASEVEELVQVTTKESELDESDIEWALKGLQWQARESRGDLELALALTPPGEVRGQLSVPQAGIEESSRRKVEADNMQTLSLVLSQRFGQVDPVIDILKWCETNYADVTDFARKLKDAAEPLTSTRVGAQPSSQSCFVTIKKDEDPGGYAKRLEEALQKAVTSKAGFNASMPVGVLDSTDAYRMTIVRTKTGLMLHEFATWDECQQVYELKLDEADNAPPDKIKDLTRSLQCQHTQTEEKAAVELEVVWASMGRRRRAIHPRVVSLLGDKTKLEYALEAWALGWVVETEDTQLPGQVHWELKVPTWDYQFWLTPNRPKGVQTILDVLEAFVLVGRNHSRELTGTLRWNELRQAIMAASKAEDGQISALRQAVEKAASEQGLYGEWKQMSHEDLDGKGNRVYRSPEYFDLAEYARRFFQSL
jgi:hypothetical protein